MNIRTYGADERLVFCCEYLNSERPRGIREMFLLPIPSSRLGDGEELLRDVLGAGENKDTAPGEIAVVGYGIPKEIKERLSSFGALVVDVSLDEEFLLENAQLTAVGTVGRLLSDLNAAPCDLSIGIIGYGRIGRALLGLLLPLGARPVVFTGNDSVRLELGASGIATASYGTLRDCEVLHGIGDLDVIINTAPERMITDGAIMRLQNTKIFELASGDNFPEGINVIRLPSLPARAYPRSAGRCLAESVLRMLER